MSYEVVKTIGVQSTPKTKREAYLVKTDPVICRGRGSFDLYEVDHVIVEAMRIVDDGVVYEETHVVASDEAGTVHEALLYQASRALTIEEAMFGIGFVLAPEVEYEASAEPEPVEENWAGTEFTPGHPMQVIKTEPVEQDENAESEDDTNGN